MKRKPYFAEKNEAVSESQIADNVTFTMPKWPKWLTTKQAAAYLGKFRRVDGITPSEGAVRNMIYRKQISARKFLGRILIDRLQLDKLIQLSPQMGGS